MTSPSICVLTQTATELPPYYREFFQGFDLFFITFKQENPDALAFLPGSTMHEGRNFMWGQVKGKYDYYLFIDDDLIFYEWRPLLPLTAETTLKRLQKHIHFTRFVPALAKMRHGDVIPLVYRKVSPARFKARLLEKIAVYQPLVASIRTLGPRVVFGQDEYALSRGRAARRLTWFDAQVTLFSQTAGDFILPYIPGWWSPQVPTYYLSHVALGDKALYILDMAASNERHTLYRDDFDGRQEVIDVIDWLSTGILDKDYDLLQSDNYYRDGGDPLDYSFGSEAAKKAVVINDSAPMSLEDILKTLRGSFDLRHPYIYSRHQGAVEALEAERPVSAGSTRG